MTLLVDDHEPEAISLYLGQMVPTTRMLLNLPAQPPRPDYGFFNCEGKYVGVSRKQAGEFIGGIDATEAQLLVEMQACDYMVLLIEGYFSCATDGTCIVWEFKGDKVYRSAPPWTYGHLDYTRHNLRQSYKGVWQKLARLQDLGIMVLHTMDMHSTAVALVALYNEQQRPEAESTTLRRLLPEKYRVDEADQGKHDLALSLMGLTGAKLGPELALGLADRFGSLYEIVTMYEGGADKEIAGTVLRGGKRTVGPAATAKLRRALGL